MSANCPLCDASQHSVYHVWPEFRVLECGSCGFRYTDLTAWNYPYANADYYDAGALENLDPHLPHLERRLADILRHCSRGRSLDVGCGKGEVPVLLAERGFEAVGIDESPRAIAGLRERYPGIAWHSGSVFSLLDDLGAFDVLTLYHVLEHLPQPVAAMQQLMRLVRPGGLIVIEVPNVDGNHARRLGPAWHYYQQHHVNYFRPRDLRRLAELLGCDVLEATGYYHLSHPQGVWWKDTVKAALAAIGYRDVFSITLRVPADRKGSG